MTGAQTLVRLARRRCHAVARAKRRGETFLRAKLHGVANRAHMSLVMRAEKKSQRRQGHQPERYRISNPINRTAISNPTIRVQIYPPASSALDTHTKKIRMLPTPPSQRAISRYDQGSHYHYACLACKMEMSPSQNLKSPEHSANARHLQAKYNLSRLWVVQMQRERRWPLRWNCRANAASLAEPQIRKPVLMHATCLGVVL